MKVPLRVTQPLPVLAMDRLGTTVAHPELGALRLGLLGRHQAANAAVALGTIDALRAAGIADASDAAIRTGLAATRWPGRLELLTVGLEAGRPTHAVPAGPAVVDGSVDVLLDGAHNAAGATALATGRRRPAGVPCGGSPDAAAGHPRRQAGEPHHRGAPGVRRAPGSARHHDRRAGHPARDWIRTSWPRRGAPVRSRSPPVDAALDAALDTARSLGGPLDRVRLAVSRGSRPGPAHGQWSGHDGRGSSTRPLRIGHQVVRVGQRGHS